VQNSEQWCVVAPPMRCPLDIIFVVDESGTMGPRNFANVKSFLSRLVSRLDIDSGKTRVGLVTFGDDVGTVYNLSAYTSVSSFQSAIMLVRHAGGTTNMAAAFEYVRKTMLTSAAGDRSNVSNVVVVITDGASDSPSATRVS